LIFLTEEKVEPSISFFAGENSRCPNENQSSFECDIPNIQIDVGNALQTAFKHFKVKANAKSLKPQNLLLDKMKQFY
jgi:hypothetical protein